MSNTIKLASPAAPTQRTIDMTPTWHGILPMLLTGWTDGNATGRKIALEELQRMARLADAYVAEHKGEPE
jgi:hypothetical protein